MIVVGCEGMNPHGITHNVKVPVHQTRHGGPDAETQKRGNCFVACLATILGLALDEVPDAAASGDEWDEITTWLLSKGWYILAHEGDPLERWVPGWSIMGVESMHEAIREETDGGGHVIVAKDGVPWFNPNPNDHRTAEALVLSASGRGNCVSYVLYPLDPQYPRLFPSETWTESRPG